MSSLESLKALVDQHDVRLIYSLLLLRFIRNEDIPRIADGMIDSHQNSSSLLQLSLIRQDDTAEIGRFLEDFVAEFGLANFTKGDAIGYLARAICDLMLSHSLSALEGATLLWDATLEYKNWDYHDLDTFVYAASEIAERPLDREMFENAILKEAKRISERLDPPDLN